MLHMSIRGSWSIWLELTVPARIGAFWTAMAAHGLTLGWFVLTWSDGLPILDGTFADHLMAVETLLLAVLLPWTGVRCSRPGELRSLLALAMITGTPQSRVIAAKTAGVAAALTVLVISGAPFAILAHRASALSLSRLPAEIAPLLALALFVATISTAGALIGLNRLAHWLLATAGSLGAVSILPHGPASTAVLLALGLTGAIALSSRGDRRGRALLLEELRG
jgi:hypothetical protein